MHIYCMLYLNIYEHRILINPLNDWFLVPVRGTGRCGKVDECLEWKHDSFCLRV